MQIISDDQMWECLDRVALVEALRDGFRQSVEVPMRHHHTIKRPEEDATLILMPAWFANGAIGIKTVTVFPTNASRSLPSIYGNYSLLDGNTGVPLASMDGRLLTLFRTAAASVLAATYLARKDASKLLMVGTGALAPHIIATYAALLDIKEVRVWGRSAEKAEAVIDQLNLPNVALALAESIESAAAWADVISCATLSKTPLIFGEWLAPGTFLDLIGAYTPTMREADDEVIRRSSIFVDTRPGALSETGDIVIPVREGVMSPADIRGDLFDLTQGRHPGRTSDDEITLFKSCGYALEDLVAAKLIYDRVQSLGV